MPVSNRAFLIALILFFASGLTALIYEILWLKELRLLFGASILSMIKNTRPCPQ